MTLFEKLVAEAADGDNVWNAQNIIHSAANRAGIPLGDVIRAPTWGAVIELINKTEQKDELLDRTCQKS